MKKWSRQDQHNGYYHGAGHDEFLERKFHKKIQKTHLKKNPQNNNDINVNNPTYLICAPKVFAHFEVQEEAKPKSKQHKILSL